MPTLYMVRSGEELGELYLFSGSYGSRWSRSGKVWSMPRNVVFAVEQSSWVGVWGPGGTVPVANVKPAWKNSFARATVLAFEPGGPATRTPVREFLKAHGGKRWAEL